MTNNNVFNANDPANIKKGSDLLKEGGIVSFPTETVYGLGADVFNPLAVAKIFEAKSRPQFDPLIVHVASIEETALLWEDTPEIAMTLMKKFWPGPLTLVLPKKEAVPDIVTAGLSTVAVRMPDHKAALELIRALGHPIAAPSANLFGYTSPTTALAVSEDLGGKVDMVLDGGPTVVGIESTVIKFEGDHAVLLRPGGVEVEKIEAYIRVEKNTSPEKNNYESPGQIESHYAPWTNLSLMTDDFNGLTKELGDYYRQLQQIEVPWPRIGLLLFKQKDFTDLEIDGHWFETVEVLSAGGDLKEAASNLFQSIRKLDKMHLDMIIAEKFPQAGLGLAIMDRLNKASGGHAPVKDFFNRLIQSAS